MALHTDIQISLGGNEVTSFKEVRLSQKINQHHELKLTIRMDVLEAQGKEIAARSKNFLGEVCTLQISSVEGFDGYGNLEFKGVVTQVQGTRGFSRGDADLIHITALSTSILADDGPHQASYLDNTLADILNMTFQEYDSSKLQFKCNPRNTEAIHYSVQNGDSAFAYANRLSAQYGEWFYYDGKALVFGIPEDAEDVPLQYGLNLKHYTVGIQPAPNNFKYFTNDYLQDTIHERSTNELPSETSGYVGFATQKGDQIYAKETSVFLNSYTDTQLQQRFDSQVEIEKRAREQRQVTISGISDNPAVNIGEVIDIQEYGASAGRYRITKVVHTATENGDYNNEFEAVTAEIEGCPNADIMRFPTAGTQVATVVENVDPEGLSRVKVQFPWQEIVNQTTPWLRMLTPHAGQDKGFHFLPEIGEEVIIQFEDANVERPFILGTLYTGNKKPDSWQSDANNIKAIRTRSGHNVILDDTDGAECIKIHDNEGSIITFDTQAKSLFIQAAENIEIAAKNIKMVAEENIELQAKADLKTASQGNTEVLAQGTTTVQSSGDIAMNSDGAVAVKAVSAASIKGQSLTAEGQTAAELKGQQTTVQGQMTVVQGASGKIDVA